MTVDRETWYRVPRSAEECAVRLEAGGVVLSSHNGGTVWKPDWRTPAVADALERDRKVAEIVAGEWRTGGDRHDEAESRYYTIAALYPEGESR